MGRLFKYIGASDCQVSYRCNADPRGLLEEGKVYEARNVDEGEFHTDIYLKGHEDKRFNSVCFDEVDTGILKVVAEENGIMFCPKCGAYEVRCESCEHLRARLALAEDRLKNFRYRLEWFTRNDVDIATAKSIIEDILHFDNAAMKEG